MSLCMSCMSLFRVRPRTQMTSMVAELEPQVQPHTPQPPSRINELANELLCLIFEFVCEENFLQEYPWLSTQHEAPTQLSSPVISYLPALSISAVKTRNHGGNYSIAEIHGYSPAFLDRSATAPLVLGVFIGWTRWDDLYEHVHPPALNMLLRHTSRWKSFHCITDRRMLDTPLSLPILEDLSLGCLGVDAANIFHCFGAAPNLRALQLSFEVSSINLDNMPRIPQHQITFLKITQRYWEMAALQNFPNLTTLELEVHGFESQNTRPHILLAQLESFTVTLAPSHPDPSDFLDDFLSMFTFPLLAVLNLHPESNQNKERFWSVNAFDAFISRSSCVLNTLSICGVAISDLELIAALQLLPSLVNFSFDNSRVVAFDHGSWYDEWCPVEAKSPITSLFFSRLTLPESPSDPGSSTQSILIPKLCSLVIKCKNTSFDGEAFIKMVLSRWLPDPLFAVDSLRSVVLRLYELEVDDNIYEPLYELDKVGMKWGAEVNEEAEVRSLCNLHRLGMRVVITDYKSKYKEK
ncbi:hypothetical protein BT96DRAFT_1019715 [Gymnopus androsaceus JB14]|uniref:F-box domain-containing protein n=1 Tax=Gymnopus androsaceus JB14 TaxID=1447944 RepID=A0A6A4HPZ8_9AGAR|nr:hypothetical protein BT96DRAFT_1019715 [Gymnopus androsaceus JB14]